MRLRNLGIALVLLLPAWDCDAQIRRSVVQFHVIGAAGTPDFAGVGLGLSRRTTARVSAGVTGSIGTAGGEFAARAEGMVLFNLDPGRRSGVAPYGGGGIVWRRVADHNDGFLLLVIGIESAPRSDSGWFLELGVGAGLRGALGWRIRR